MKLEGQARDAMILDILKGIDEARHISPDLSDRKSVWDDTWKESLERLVTGAYNPAMLTPRYFTQREPYRIRGEFYSSEDHGWEVLKHTQYLREKLFKTWLLDAKVIREFGCGSGWNLAYIVEAGHPAILYGYDWSKISPEILYRLARNYGWKLSGQQMDMRSPTGHEDMSNSHVFTWGSMEQLGYEHTFKPFVDWLIERRPKLVLNVEPILDFYDPTNLSDFLCGQYHTKRGYLAGFLPYLKKLEKDGVIAIETIHRERFSGKFHEALSHIVWRPL